MPRTKRRLGDILRRKIRPLQAEIWDRNAQESPFLRLPAEIRQMICEYAMGGNVILVTRCHDKPYTNKIRFQYDRREQDTIPFNGDGKTPKTAPIAPLHRVCRQLYKETVVLAFKVNTWAFRRINTLDEFAAKKCMRAQRGVMHALFLNEDWDHDDMYCITKAKRAFPGMKTVRLLRLEETGHVVLEFHVTTQESNEGSTKAKGDIWEITEVARWRVEFDSTEKLGSPTPHA